jgi:UDP-GlcNAc:undecaprenyl-phosphate GlcNAc-1-phosphate transferase
VQLSTGQYSQLFLYSLFLVGLLTPIIRGIAVKVGAIDLPHEAHKTHKNPIPYLGGLAIILGVCIITYSSIWFYGKKVEFSLANTVLIPAAILGLVGLIDDLKKLSPWSRFLFQNLIGVVMAIVLISTNTLGSPSGNSLVDFIITILWIVGITNSINFFDNLDGGASGAVAIAALFLFFLALQGSQFFIAALSIVLAGATMGFLVWNKPPARIYMGDAGALFLGLLIATLTLRFDPNPINLIASFAIPILILAVPILDTTVAVLSRLRRGISPFQGGKDHLSHRLMRRGLNKRQSVISLWLLSVFFGCLAIGISNAAYTIERGIVYFSAVIWLILLWQFLRFKDS